MDADMALEDVWADLEEVLGDRMPDRVYPEDRTWFTLQQYQARYGHSYQGSRDWLDEQVEDGLLERQAQRRGNHNVRCYRAVKDRPGI